MADQNEHITIKVNEQEVRIGPADNTPGAIKARAIEQNVDIEIDFELAGETKDGKRTLIRETETVDIETVSIFMATSPDDNS